MGVVIYPTSYLIHIFINEKSEDKFELVHKSVGYPTFANCLYKITLENKYAKIKKCLPSKKIYNNVIINSIVKAKTNKSFFGLTIDSFELEIEVKDQQIMTLSYKCIHQYKIESITSNIYPIAEAMEREKILKKLHKCC